MPETARCYAWYAGAIDKIYDENAPTGPDALATITREALGVVAAVVPWNYPLMMAAWKVGAALAAGNSVILKPAEQASLSAIRLAALAEQAGIPAGVFSVVPGLGAQAGQALGLQPDVDCIAFTGSTATGKRFMEYSGQSNLKRVWLECGGKSPHIVFEDCLISTARRSPRRWAFSPTRAKSASPAPACTCRTASTTRSWPRSPRMPPPCSPAIRWTPPPPWAPLVDERQMRGVLATHRGRRRRSVRLRMGGRQALGATGGYYIRTTIFDCADQGNSLVREEIFGPVLAAQRFATEDDAVRLANDSVYGLGAGLWTARPVARPPPLAPPARRDSVVGGAMPTATSPCLSAGSSSPVSAETNRCTRWTSTAT